MARIFLLIFAVGWGLFGFAPASAQNAQLEQARAELQAGRDQIIREDLGLSEAELAAFWPVYEQYLAALAPVRERKRELVSRFLEAYGSGEFSDDLAAWLIEENEMTLKYFFDEGDMIRLQPANDDYLPIYADRRNVRVQGKVVKVIRYH